MCSSKRGQGVERTGVKGKMRNSGEIDLYELFQSCKSNEVRAPATGEGRPRRPSLFIEIPIRRKIRGSSLVHPAHPWVTEVILWPLFFDFCNQAAPLPAQAQGMM